MVVQKRRDLLFRHVDVRTQRGLEIGPYLQPTVRKDEGRIEYLDFYTAEELAEQEFQRTGASVEVPPVDHVVKSDDYFRHVQGEFDYVIANHVIEHVDNPIQWLIDLARLVREDGVLFLAVPDKKYNFDRYRSDTPLSHLLADWFRGRGAHEEHGVDIVLFYDTAYVGKPLDAKEKLDIEKLRNAFAEPSHPGRHNHVFQSETFVRTILRPLQYLGAWPYTLLDFGPAPQNHGEFHLVLRKRPEDVGEEVMELFRAEPPPVGGEPPCIVTPMKRFERALRRAVRGAWSRVRSAGRNGGG
ncbi:MAG: hypothetical protein Fur0037_00670 [Planctomycetota bacterium]